MTSELLSLHSLGYCKLAIDSTDEFIEFASGLGALMPSRKNSPQFLDELTVSLTRTDRSMSAKFKTSSFPYHTDGAYLHLPPRFVLLRSEKEYLGCGTGLCFINPSDLEKSMLRKDVWFVNGGRGKFYSSMLAESDGNDMVRYDLECMRPSFSDPASLKMMQVLIEKGEKLTVCWEKNLTLVIDNWRILHCREDASNYQDRVLQRIWVSN